jgi:hypothetical protein
VGQSSSQHDKCQVGNMHTYSLDLVHFWFSSIMESSIQSFNENSLTESVVLRTLLSLYLNLYMYPYLFVYLVSLGDGLKKRVFRLAGYLRGRFSGP